MTAALTHRRDRITMSSTRMDSNQTVVPTGTHIQRSTVGGKALHRARGGGTGIAWTSQLPVFVAAARKDLTRGG